MEKPKTLREQLEDDFKKFKKFIKEKKNYIFWIIVMFITIQFTDVLSLGASWDEMVKQNPYLKKNGTVLRGGDVKKWRVFNSPHFWQSYEHQQLLGKEKNIKDAAEAKEADLDKKLEQKKKELNQQKKNLDKSYKEGRRKKPAQNGFMSKADYKKQKSKIKREKQQADINTEIKKEKAQSAKMLELGKAQANKDTEMKKKKKADQDAIKPAQDRQAIREAKKKDKKNTPGLGKSFQSFREGGPMVKIFGNMFNMFRASVAIFAILLALAGAASIPVILFLVLTYKILEFLAGKLQQL